MPNKNKIEEKKGLTKRAIKSLIRAKNNLLKAKKHLGYKSISEEFKPYIVELDKVLILVEDKLKA